MMRLVVLSVSVLVPLLAAAQCPELREITRQANIWLLVCDGVRQPITQQQYEALAVEGASVNKLCPEGTQQGAALGGVVQFDTASGDAETCDLYQFQSGPTRQAILPNGDERTIDTRVNVPTRTGNRVIGFSPPISGIITR